MSVNNKVSTNLFPSDNNNPIVNTPKVVIRSSSPVAENSIQSILSSSLSRNNVNVSSRSRSNSVKLLKHRLQNINNNNINNTANNININSIPNSNASPKSSMEFNTNLGLTSVDDLVSEAGPDYINLNLKSYNKYLITYLSQQGLNMNPLKLQQNKIHNHKVSTKCANSNIQTFLTGNGQILFLPFNPQKKKRRRDIQEEYNDDHDEDEGEEGDEGDEDESDNENSEPNNRNNNQKNMDPNHHNVTSHTFGIIVKFSKEERVNPIVKANYHAHALIKWLASEKSKRPSFDERYKISKDINWDLNLKNPDCYIPFKKLSNDYDNNDLFEDDELSNDDLSTSISNRSSDISFSPCPTQKIRTFEPLDQKNFKDEKVEERGIESNLFGNHSQNSKEKENHQVFQPGYYIFLLPVVYPINTPETIFIPNGRIIHEFAVQIEKQPYKPLLSSPPSALISTSPTHHYKYDDQNFELEQQRQFHQRQLQIKQQQSQSQSSTQSPKSFLKMFGMRRNSNSSSLPPPINVMSASPPSKSLTSSILPSFHHSSTIHNFEYQLPAIRLPPSDATSTLNKSIYVNKVWNKSLNYELLLPKKFTQLSPPNFSAATSTDNFLKKNSFVLQMKLIPLVKNLCLKRIKINIVEKITYTSKGNNSTIDSEANKNERSRVKERTVTMLEIKTKERSNGATQALNTQVIKDCKNDNLLTYCYNNQKINYSKHNTNTNTNTNTNNSNNHHIISPSSNGFLHSSRMSRLLDHSSSNTNSPANNNNNANSEDIIITNPVKLQCPLSFTASDDFGFISSVHENLHKGTTDINELHDDEFDKNDVTSIFSVGSHNTFENFLSDEDLPHLMSRSPVRSQRRNSISSYLGSNHFNNSNVKTYSKEDEKSRSFSFYPDTSFHNLKIRHRLQICFRISKADDHLKNPDGEPKMHHYEVIVDTPIVFISPFCVSEALDLPSYEYAVKLSSFELPTNVSQFVFSQANNDSDENDQLPPFQNATFSPCSPLMSGISNNLMPTSLPTSNVNSTTILSKSPFSDISRASTPGNGTSLLSAAFGKSMDKSNNLNLANDVSSLSLNSNINNGNSNTGYSIDDVFSKEEFGSSNPKSGNLTNMMDSLIPPPPDYVKEGGLSHVPSKSSLALQEGDGLPTYDDLMDREKNENEEQKLERLGLLSDDDNDEYTSTLNTDNDDDDSRNDIISVNTLEEALPILNFTPTHNVL